ncbi:MAG: protein kinase, partial [bacterium]
MRRARPFGPYSLLYRIASGGMAELYRARRGDRDVALKRPLGVYNDDEQFIVMLTDEARVTALFDHPNIARTYEFGVVDGQYFLAMEYIDGVDLRAVIRRAGERRERVAAETAAWVVEAALRGLDHAHGARDEAGRPLGLIHRDFSPSNIV